MNPNDLTPEQRLEIIQIVLKYSKYMLAEECEPELGTELWMELCDWMDDNVPVK